MRGEAGKNDIHTTDNRQKTKLVVKNHSELFPDETDKHDSTNVQSEKIDSPLRQALSSMTPLLAATLNTPPVHLVTPFPTSSPPPLTAVDLSQTSCQSNESPPVDNRHDEGHAMTYSTLLLNMRERAAIGAGTKDINGNQAIKLTAAARREKLKLQPSFQCPVCKKRFQRHIAMSAHFQNEHIGSNGKSSEKFCKLCTSFSNGDIVLLRKHLLNSHKIDLENPVSCLVDAEHSPSPITITKVPSSPTSLISFSGKKGRKKGTTRPHSPDDDSSSASSLSDNITSTSSSSSATPEQRLSPPVILGQVLVKPEPLEEEATDLTIPKASEASQPQLSPLKRAKSASPIQSRSSIAKRAKIESKHKQKPIVPEESGLAAKFQCYHCQITFPNQTLYFLHRGFHSDIDPWKCNGCGQSCVDMYDFNTHLVSVSHN